MHIEPIQYREGQEVVLSNWPICQQIIGLYISLRDDKDDPLVAQCALWTDP